MAKYVIGVDIGTTSTKVIVYDQQGHIHARANNGYALYQNDAGMAEENPQDIYRAVIAGLTTVMRTSCVQPQDVTGVGFSAAMHSLMLVDAGMRPLTRVMTWADNRAAGAVPEIRAAFAHDDLFARTPVPAHPMTPIAKLVWLNRTQPALMRRTRYVLGIKEYVLYRMTGELVADYSIANATGLFNVQTMDWDDGALNLAGIRRQQLPRLVDTDYQLSSLDAQVAATTGLAPRTPLVVGASDGVLSNLGLGAITPGSVAVTIGTSGAVRAVVDQPRVDPAHRLFTYYLAPGRWVVGGPVNNGGNVLQWVQDALFPQLPGAARKVGISDVDVIMHAIAAVPAGADGLLCLPFLRGERAPLWRADMRGAFVGLTPQHTRVHMARATLEGVALNLKAVMTQLAALVGPLRTVRAAGGFAHSAPWCQILADVLDQPLTIPSDVDSSAWGAAVMAMQSVGLIDSLDAVQSMTGQSRTVEPHSAAVATYRQLYLVWRDAVRSMTDISARLTALQ